jgi:hypothetical protein
MPPGTPAHGVLAAARNFLREEFALKHRYAFVLHTDEPHPHVHAVVKAVGEQGARLNVRKATLREWRANFARHLRAQAIEANATERAVRGQYKGPKLDGIYRAMRDGGRFSTHMVQRTKKVAEELLSGGLRIEFGKSKMMKTRDSVTQGWQVIGELLAKAGESKLAASAGQFAHEMPLPATEKEQIAAALMEHTRHPQMKERPPIR